MNVEYITLYPQKQNTISEEIEALLLTLKSTLQNNNFYKKRILRACVFYDPSIGAARIKQLKNTTIEYFQPSIPAISFLAQPPLNKSGGHIAMEIWHCKHSESKIEFKQYNNIYYCLISSGSEQNIIISGIQDITDGLTIQQQTQNAFHSLEAILRLEDFSFTDIVRQWNYIENILDTKNNEQNYQIFNDIRTQFYNKHGLTNCFPAATGIGIKEGGIIIEIHAVKNINFTIADITNPLQTDAFDYTEKVLEGTATSGLKNKTTPKFSRAKLIANQASAQILISGTASIQGEETIGIDNIEKQTNVTIENIGHLISEEAISKHILPTLTNNTTTELVRVYIKNREDYQNVKDICEALLPCENTMYVEADICRDNLLVEIEVIALSTLS